MKGNLFKMSLVIIVLLLLLIIPLSVNAAEEGIFSYSNWNGKATVEGLLTEVEGELIIPETLGGYPVTMIGSIQNQSKITSVTIPDSVTTIGDHAFRSCTGLTYLEIPNSVTHIGGSAFNGCKNLEEIVLSENITEIEGYTFENCEKLTKVIIPNSVTSIGAVSFRGCVSLRSITIPDSVTEIGSSAFKGCISLTNIIIPNSVTKLGTRVFEDCENLLEISLGNGMGVIDEYTFRNCSSLTYVAIPRNIESIKYEAFRNCSSLTNILIPDSVNYMGSNVFYNCDNLDKVYFEGTKNELRALYTFDGSVDLICNYIPATQIELNKTVIELHPGNTTQLTATITPSNATYDYVLWSSSDTEIATVTAEGLVEVLDEGNVTITATSVDGFLSNTCEIEVTPKLTPTCNAPTNATATYGQSLSDVVLDNPNDNTDGQWAWVSPEELVGDVGSRTFKATFTPADTDNYVIVENIDVTVSVEPKNISIQIDDIDDENYLNEQIKPSVEVNGDGKTLVLNTDYSVEYSENIYAGIGSVTVKSKTEGSNYTFADTTKDFNIVAIEQSPIITEAASLTRDGHTLDLNTLVTNAKGDVSFAISGEANGCTIDNGVLTSGVNQGTIAITVSITAKDVNGDTINEYNAYAETDVITVTINDKSTQAALNITSGTTVTRGRTLTLTTEGGNGDGVVSYAVTNGTGEATIENNVLTAVKVGTVTVVATKAEDATYNSISSDPITITIEAKSSGGGGGGGGGATIKPPVKEEKEPEKEDEKQEEIKEPTQPEKPSTSVKFNDVKENDWYFDYVTELAEKGIVSGNGNGVFAPNANVTREQFLKMLLEATDIEAEECENVFTDVADEWYKTYVLKAKGLGIVNGVTDTEFGIGSNITRQDMAVMITRVIEKANINVNSKDVAAFDDNGKVSDYAQDAVKYMKSIGLIEGYNNQYRPNDNLTRAEAAKVICELLKLYSVN